MRGTREEEDDDGSVEKRGRCSLSFWDELNCT